MEEKLLALLLKNPDRGLEKLINSYAGLVYAIVYEKLASVCSKEDMEECVSSVFFEVYEKRSGIDLSKGTLKAFLAVIAKRRSIDIYRKKEKSMGRVIPLQEYAGEASDDGGFSETETREMLINGIKSLGEPDSEIFIRRYYLGQSTKMIAAALGLKENTVDKKISRGLAGLRTILAGEAGAEEGKDGRYGRKDI